jgi:hypothetical protein
MLKWKIQWIVLLVLIVTCAYGQEYAVTDNYMVPAIFWQGLNNQYFAIQRTSNMETNWQTVDGVPVRSNGVQRWADKNTANEVKYFYRVKLLPETNRPFSDGFEIAGGWTDQLSSAWTSTVASGTWSGYRCNTVDISSNSHESDRCLCITNPFPNSCYLILPRVNYPTQLVFWAKVSRADASMNLQSGTFDGLNWSDRQSCIISSTNYEMISLPLWPSLPNQPVKLRIVGGNSNTTLFIDDIQIFAK